MISTAVETHKGFRVQSRVEITENLNSITRDQERLNVEKPYGMAQKLRLMIGTFTHWAHVISVCVLQEEIQSGSNMTGTDLCVNKPHCAAAVRP